MAVALLWCALILPDAAVAAEPPRRVVTLAPHLAELVCAAGACKRLAGVVKWSDHPPEVRALAQVGDAFSVNVEAVLALDPDLVLGWDGGTPPGTIHRLRDLGLPVEVLTTRRLADIAEALRWLGRRLGTGEVARDEAARFESSIAALRAAHAKSRPLRVLYQIELEPIFTISGESPISEALAICGGQNVFADLPVIAAPVSLEAVVAANPEVIVFARQNDLAAVRAYWAAAPPVAASRAGTLVSVDADLLARPAPRMAAGVGDLCRALDGARAALAPVNGSGTR